MLMKFGSLFKKLFWNNRHNQKEKPIATHLPFGLTKQGDDYFITGHMAYGNPQWRTFETCEDVLVMFRDRTLISLLLGMKMKKFQHGIIKLSIYMVKQVF